MPSRLRRIQINPKITRELESRVRDFLHDHRPLLLQDMVEEALEMYLAKAAEVGRPAVQPSSRPDSDQIPDLKIEELKDDRSIIDQETGRPAVQNDFELHRTFCERLKLDKQTIATFFEPLQFLPTGTVVTITAPNDMVRVWIEQRYKTEMWQTLSQLGFESWNWQIAAGKPTAIAEPVTSQRTAADCMEELLALYQVVTENKLTAQDREAFSLVLDCKPESIRAGIFKAQISCMKRKDRIGRFKYCLKPIRQIEDAGMPGLRLVETLEQEFMQMKQMSLLGGSITDLEGKK